MTTPIGKLERLPISQLGPDWENPRFLPGATDDFESDADIYVYLDAKYDAFSVAESIARHGFFEAEPLIATPTAESPPEAAYTVLEGNRRLTALKALGDPAIRQRMNDRRWKQLPATVETPDFIPVVIVQDRIEVAPLLGFRHVTGISPWDPYQQALYVAEMIDARGLSADEVGTLIGRDPGEIRGFYRNFSIVEQAEEEFEIDDAKRIVDEFGTWNRAMTSVGLRAYIGAPAPRDVVEREVPLDPHARDELARLVTWIFGAPRSKKDRAEGKQSRRGRAITDSRHLNRLSKAIHHERGLAALMDGGSLEDAEQAMLDSRARFLSALDAASKALKAAEDRRPNRLPKKAVESLDEMKSRIERLQG